MKVRIPHVIAIGAGVCASMVIYVDAADAGRGGGRGGGARGGGMSSMSRGGGGGGFSRGSSSFSGGRSSYNRGPSSGSGFNRPSTGTRPSAGTRPSTGTRPSAGTGAGGGFGGGSANRPSAGTGDRTGAGTRPSGGDRGNRGDGNRGDGNRGDRPDRGDNTIGGGDRNTNINNNTNINIDNDGWGGWDDGFHHPIAAGVVIGTTAAITAAALTPYPYYGAAYYALPSGCGGYPYYGYSYYRCDGYYLEPRYEGDTVVYVNVPDPASSEGKAYREGKTPSAPTPNTPPASSDPPQP